MTDLFTEKSKDFDASDMIQNMSLAIGSSILKKISFNDKMNVMDFGAGTGLISSHVAPLVNKIVAVDISESMLDKLTSKSNLRGKVEAVCQNILDKPLGEKFDLIMSAMALHHIRDTNDIIRVMSDHLNSGAMVALADLDKEDGSFHPENTEGVFHFGFDRDGLKAILEDNGFCDVQFDTAHTINGETNDYPIFLVIATKH